MNGTSFTIRPEVRKTLKKIMIVSGILALAYMLTAWIEKTDKGKRPSR